MRDKVVPDVITALLIGCVALFFYSLFYPSLQFFAFPDFAQSDLWQQSMPSKYFLSESLKSGQLPLWNPYVGMGYPEYAKAEIGTFYLPNLLLYSLFDFATAFNLMYVVTFLIMSTGMLALGLRMGLSCQAAVLMAIFFPYSGFFLTKFPHASRIESAALIPWIMYSLDVFLRRPRVLSGAMLALLMAQQLYAGHFQIVFMTLMLVGGYALFLIWQQKSVKLAFKLTAVLFLFVCMSAVQLLPSLELIDLTQRAEGFDQAGALAFSFPWSRFVHMFLPFYGGGPHLGPVEHYSISGGDIFWENATYIGIVGCALSVLGLLKKHVWRIPLVIVLVFSILLMTGKYSPLYFVHSIFPFSFFRAPSKYTFLFIFALTLLAGIGMDTLLKIMKSMQVKKQFTHLAVVLIVATLLFELWSFHRQYAVYIKTDELLQKPFAADYVPDDTRYISMGSGVLWNAIFLKQGWQSTEEFNYLLNALRPNVNVLYGKRSLDVYEILSTRRQSAVSEMAQALIQSDTYSTASAQFLQLYNISAIIAPNIPEAYGLSTSIPAPESYLNHHLPELEVVVNDTTSPRLSMVHSYVMARTLGDVSSFLANTNFAASASAILEPSYQDDVSSVTDSDAHSELEVLRDDNHHISVQIQTDKPGLFIVGDSYYPGWEATIDGESVAILPANVNQRAVVVPEGNHRVDMVFKPESFKNGLLISGLSYVITALLVGRSLARRKF